MRKCAPQHMHTCYMYELKGNGCHAGCRAVRNLFPRLCSCARRGGAALGSSVTPWCLCLHLRCHQDYSSGGGAPGNRSHQPRGHLRGPGASERVPGVRHPADAVRAAHEVEQVPSWFCVTQRGWRQCPHRGRKHSALLAGPCFVRDVVSCLLMVIDILRGRKV